MALFVTVTAVPMSQLPKLSLPYDDMDPIMKGLMDGTLEWGDVPFEDTSEIKHLEPKLGDSSEEEASCSDSEEYLCKSPRSVPQFIPGIKTLIARNLPRDITVYTLKNIFTKYGPIRDIYIPKNMDKSSPYFGTIKGFALVKFLNPSDSASAYNQEYGKCIIGSNRITIEFAKEDRK